MPDFKVWKDCPHCRGFGYKYILGPRDEQCPVCAKVCDLYAEVERAYIDAGKKVTLNGVPIVEEEYLHLSLGASGGMMPKADDCTVTTTSYAANDGYATWRHYGFTWEYMLPEGVLGIEVTDENAYWLACAAFGGVNDILDEMYDFTADMPFEVIEKMESDWCRFLLGVE